MALRASHNLAGQVTAEQVDPNNPNLYRITLTTYTDPAPQGVDRCSANIYIFNRTTGAIVDSILDIPRANGPAMTMPNADCNVLQANNGVEVRGTVKENIYTALYTFPGPSEYDLVYYDINRFGGIVNIPNPESKSFSVVTTLQVRPLIAGSNTTPLLLNRPIDDACVGEVWTHQPGAWDVDGDSLSYEIVGSLDYDANSRYDPGVNPGVPAGYTFPDNAIHGNSSLDIDPLTGIITWTTPQTPGVYNFGINVYEWRNGRIAGEVRRDIAVWVYADCRNNPPVVESITDTCVYAGQELRFDYIAFDPDSVDSLYLALNNGDAGNNGPFIVNDPASLSGEVIDLGFGPNRSYTTLPQSTNNNDNLPGTSDSDTIKGTVVWTPNCSHIRRQHYQVDFYATDNKRYNTDFFPTKRTLATYRSVRITVIPPPPTNLQTSCEDGRIRLTWDPPSCQGSLTEYRIYRRANGSSTVQDSSCCEVKPVDQGYQLIATVDSGETTFFDPLANVEGGLGDSLCYAVTAVFREGIIGSAENPESCQADACIAIDVEPIYFTNDSIGVDYTDPANGNVFLSWSQPTIDPCVFPPPYTFHLYRANNNGFPAIEIATLSYQDTTYLDRDIDTENRGYNYRVEIFAADERRIESSGNGENLASTIFLEVNGIGSGLIELTWKETVAWRNAQYEIYRADNGGPYDLLTVVPGTGLGTHDYVDSALNPSWEYCYFIRSIGSWNEATVKDPLINDSQAACDFAQDDEPPCPPTGRVAAPPVNGCPQDVHQLTITKSDQGCDGDTRYISVEFSPSPGIPFRPLPGLDRIRFDSFGADTTIGISPEQRFGDGVGCYALRAEDSLGNISELSTITCVDYCPQLVPSNVFTPNGDGKNDRFRPLNYRDVRLVSIRIFDRYGRLVHQASADIDNLWDGITQAGKPAPDGVYFYLMDYEELSLSENRPITIKASVTLLR
jgi:gliding motility-associated-like protein